MGGTCVIDSTLGRDGVVHRGARCSVWCSASATGRRSPRAEAVAANLAGTTIEWSLSDDIEQIMWEKLIFLARAGRGDLCCCRAICAKSSAPRRSRGNGAGACRQRRDCGARRASAERVGAGLRQNPIDQSGRPVERLDAARYGERRRGRVEANHVVGWMLERARRHGVADALLSLAFTHLKSFEARRDANRLPNS